MSVVVNIGNNTGNSGGIQDNFLDSGQPNANNGAAASVHVGVTASSNVRKTQMRFDLSSIPSNATVLSAKLYLYENSFTTANPISIYKIADANGDWVEGSGNNAQVVGAPCWNYKAYNTANYAGGAGMPTAGTDYVNTSLCYVANGAAVVGWVPFVFNSDGIAVIQSWVNTTGGNGVVLIGSASNNTLTAFNSSIGTDNTRPYLEVLYTTAGEELITIGNNTGQAGSIEDTYFDTSNANSCYGAAIKTYCGSISAGRYIRALQRFDLSAVPNATITSARLYVWDTNYATRTVDDPISIYKIADANGDWVEGSGNNAAVVGDPCWDKKIYNTVSWAGSAGLNTAGTDYVDTVLASKTFTDGISGYRYFECNADGLAVLQSWRGTTGGNGVLLIGSTTAAAVTEWHSKTGTDTLRPFLQICYSNETSGSLYLSGPQHASCDVSSGGQIGLNSPVIALEVTELMPSTGDFSNSTVLCTMAAVDGGRIALNNPLIAITNGGAGQLSLTALLPTLSVSALNVCYLDVNSVAQIITIKGGGFLDLSAKNTTLAIAGSINGSIEINLPLQTLEVSGADGSMGTLGLLGKNIPVCTTAITNGGKIAINALVNSIAIAGGDLSEGDLIANSLLADLSISGIEGTHGPFALIYPLVTIAIAGSESTSGSLVANVPIVVLTANDFAGLYRCIVMNQHNLAITEYANCNFNSLVQIGDKVFLASETGLHLMGGENDNGTAIDAQVRTVLDDFGSPNVKNVSDGYLSVRASETIMVATVEDDGTLSSEQEVYCGNTDLKNNKVNFAKGKKQRYWGVEIRNTNGGTLDIDGIDLNVNVLRRKV